MSDLQKQRSGKVTHQTPKKKKENPISLAVKSWLQTVQIPSSLSLEDKDGDTDIRKHLVEKAPKRWVVYEPMVLLPSGSFTAHLWVSLLESVSHEQKEALWREILKELSSQSPSPLTHLAVNEGIPLHNLLRSPSGLNMLHGDFGPALSRTPTKSDFEAAFWVTTKQNGIMQTWAPRWTMFSRGNVKEKARLLSSYSQHNSKSIERRNSWAIDLYAGIGYFVFSYAKLGLRVLCWELNPWSVEGLRRGALANKWSVRLVTDDELLAKPMNELVGGKGGEEQIIVFLEDNCRAKGRIRELGMVVVHINCGFLPSSSKVWRSAWEIMNITNSNIDDAAGWLHLHENVGVKDIDKRKQEIQDLFDGWAHSEQQQGDYGVVATTKKKVTVQHVEMVKTFAPDVWHVVFDVYITRL
ncbi:S-adenosyl-L-methionine-dependent methyltransferase [Apodospora peruviana]|uniref:tRNA wybutosine-synthesizing protein 2 n=1 Tax=Apodospora peruviana TaxID=516989 RepID=A0AAE0HXI7_9PEZI|nr:S-adenosyl-L-methionine-dependent methyltransferase [Apodospora peruviana]